MKKKLSIVLIIFFSLSLCVKAQNLEETLSNLSETAGSAYVEPIISAFGSNLNSGWVSQLPSATKLGLHIDVKIAAMGSFFSNDVKRFSTTGNFYFTSDQVDEILHGSNIYPNQNGMSQAQYDQLKETLINEKFNVQFSGPTIVGSKDEYLNIRFPGKTIQSYTVDPYDVELQQVKGFLDELPALPMAAAQLTVGTVAGTNVAFRYFPSIDVKDLGKFSFWGTGFIHNPGVWFPNPLPLDVAVGYFYQQLKVGDIFESHASQFGIYAGKTIGILFAIKPYVGLTIESSKTTVKYTYDSIENIGGTSIPVKVPVEIELKGNNSVGALIGVSFKLAAVNINVDYKAAKTSTVSGGISLGW